MNSTGSSKFTRGRNKNRHSDRRRIHNGRVVAAGGGRDGDDNGGDEKRYRKGWGGGVDVVDDFLDGRFKPGGAEPRGAGGGAEDPDPRAGRAGAGAIAAYQRKDDDAVRCARHGRKCKLLTVKKPGPNKGRKFHVCCLPKGEGCDFFQWQSDTCAGIRNELANGSTKSSFVKRRVAEWRRRFQGLTIKELRHKHGGVLEEVRRTNTRTHAHTHTHTHYLI